MSRNKNKEIRYEKVVEWDKDEWSDKNILRLQIISMIPIVGQIVFLVFLVVSFEVRKVYWRRIQ